MYCKFLILLASNDQVLTKTRKQVVVRGGALWYVAVQCVHVICKAAIRGSGLKLRIVVISS